MHYKFLYLHIYRAKWIKFLTAQLRLGDCIILSGSDTQEPVFGIVKMILCDEQYTLLCINRCEVVGYQEHLKAWEIQLSQMTVVKFNMQMSKQILQPIPANYNTYYISLKHALWLCVDWRSIIW